MLYGAYDFTLSQFLCKWENGHWIEDLYDSWNSAYNALRGDVSPTCIITAHVSDTPRILEDEVIIVSVDYGKSLFLEPWL